jgi:SAM-dependent methyltransferase
MESCPDGDDDKHEQEEDDSSLLLGECTVHPFEWLTSIESLHDILLLALETSTTSSLSNTIVTQTSSAAVLGARVLDVGCGSSILGEYLLEHPTLSRLISQVVNVDRDPATLQAMQERWKQKCASNSNSGHDFMDRLLFLPPTDFVTQSMDCPFDGSSGSFHVVVDKSTLDCALCTDYAAAALICQVYRLLRPNNGVYLIISFHHVDFLRPLLQDCPGTDWELTFHVIHRQVSEKESNGILLREADAASSTSCILPPQLDPLNSNGTTDASSPLSAWSSGCFNPTESYRRTVNAVLCRRRDSQETSLETTANELDRDAVYQHINETTEQWYRFQNNRVTEHRT